MARVTLLSRQDCSLCEDAARDLRHMGIDFATLDIDEHPDLLAKYNETVPVLMLDGRELAHAPLSDSKLRIALAREGIGPTRIPRA
jgi:thioredoxin reductase (NADPH)